MRGWLPISRQKVRHRFSRGVEVAGEDVGKSFFRVDVVNLRGSCRTPNYAEREGFPQLSFRADCICLGIVCLLLPLSSAEEKTGFRKIYGAGAECFSA